MPDQSEKKATITLDTANSDRQFPAYQLSINAMDSEKTGHGYRLMGPKYVGRSKNLRTVTLSQWDADEIRAILDEVFAEDARAKSKVLALVERALLKTTDGADVDDDFAIPAGEIRRILADL
ncbi:hypothetical protein ACFVOR_37385 [Streptomyces sp. NPDC057837]|uniref:hypothetical protein n=1 Tax=Streptomyces sp. NPDC057837 TaxID=3346260 RepID=UPI003699F63E